MTDRVLLLGSGELGKEVAIELMRLGAYVIAADRYSGAPAQQVAHESRVLDMLDESQLRALIAEVKPDVIVPEIEAIATSVLVDVEAEGVARVAPTARATHLTMNREGIRRLVAEDLGIRTSDYRFVSSLEDLRTAAQEIGLPVVIKPVMSSSGKGQSTVRLLSDCEAAWEYACSGGRAGGTRVIVEGFVTFDDEVTLLTCRSVSGTVFCPPVYHIQEDGDYRESWQELPGTSAVASDARMVPPHKVSSLRSGTLRGPQVEPGSRSEPTVETTVETTDGGMDGGTAQTPEPTQPWLPAAQAIATRVTDALGGYGLFGVELFIAGDQVIFSEVSPRPHDTGMVTMASQELSEFAMHARAVLRLPVPEPVFIASPGQGAAASCAVLAEGQGTPCVGNLAEALAVPTAQVRVFGKPSVDGRRRVAVTLARGATSDEARQRARDAAAALEVTVD
ncbi:MAG: formate-dependent phosphoribosylglycinamide formyltransferase [Cellulomonadaceae bacterium]|jgi:phosphoribosylglycinamide formyltransferase 2|nr:formate-dependent phosphoribosylglycinamide formyltransferase [Cellulomonadaceae bacterium]